MAAHETPDLELLLAHSGWVRRLARQMVGSGPGADDLVQETWVAALEREAGPIRSPRGWLARVIGNLARERRRSEARRDVRERRALEARREEHAPSAADSVETLSTAQELSRLVLELDEPFRTAIVLRYYEDLAPRDIAERLGVPVRTVNSRLARALERLRARWPERAGDENEAGRALRALAGLLPAPAAVVGTAGGGSIPIGVLLVNAKLVLGALLLGGGAVAWWLGSGSDSGHALLRETPPSVAETPPSVPRVEDLTAPAEEPPERAALAAAEAASVAESEPIGRRMVHGRVLDAEARALEGIEIGYRPDGNPEPTVRTRSGPGGSFELALARGSGVLRATDPELVTVLSGRVGARTGVEPLIVVAPRLDLAGRVLDERGAPLSGVLVSFVHPPGFHARFEAVRDATEASEWRTRSVAEGRFGLGAVPAIAAANLVAELAGYQTLREELPLRDEPDLVLTLAREKGSFSAISGRVVDGRGAPVAGAWVSLGARSTASDAAGEFRLDRSDATDSFELRAMKAGYRLARLAALPGADGKPLWPEYAELVLDGAPLELSGRVVDRDGAPRPGLRVWLADPTPFGVLMDDMLASVEFHLADAREGEPLGDAYYSWRETDEDGRFTLEGLLERDYSVRVLDHSTLEIATFGPFRAGDGAREIVFAGGALGRIRGRAVSRSGLALAGLPIQLVGRTFGGVWTHGAGTETDAEGRFVLEGIGGEDLVLSVSGDDIVPSWTPVTLSRGGEAEVELCVSVRCHIQVDLGLGPERAEGMRVLDAEGVPLELYRIGPGGSYRNEEFPLVEGRSEALGVDERAHTLVLLRDGQEVARFPLALRPRTLNLITP